MNQGLTHLYIMRIKMLFLCVSFPVFLCGQQFLDLKLSHKVIGEYSTGLNIEFGQKWWGVEAEVGYQFGRRSSLVFDSNFTTYDYRVENFRWKLVGNFYPFR